MEGNSRHVLGMALQCLDTHFVLVVPDLCIPGMCVCVCVCVCICVCVCACVCVWVGGGVGDVCASRAVSTVKQARQEIIPTSYGKKWKVSCLPVISS